MSKELEELRRTKAQKQQPLTDTRSHDEKQAYVNFVGFSGRLGKDVEYTVTQTGKELAKSSLAVFNPGNKEHNTIWFDLVMWLNETATDKGKANSEEFLAFMNMEKGQEVVVDGRLSMRMWNEKPYFTITLTAIS